MQASFQHITHHPDLYVPGTGNPNARLMVVGEAPGRHEVLLKIPFSGPSGAILDEALRTANIDPNEIYKTNACKIRPPDNDIKKLILLGHKLEDFEDQLWDEVNCINPNCILAVGDTALQVLTGYKGIKNYRGSILESRRTNHKVVATLHPASLLHGSNDSGGLSSWKELAYIKKDIQRAVYQSTFPQINLPQRTLWFAKNSYEVSKFLDRHQSCEYVTLDVETYKTYAQCIGLAFNRSEACSIPLFWDEIALHDRAFIWRLLAEFLQDTRIKIIAHNAKFDEKRCRQIGLKWHDCYFDTGIAWHLLYPEFPKKLQFLTSVITEEPYYKDEGSEYDPKKHKIDRWFLYNAKDAAVEFECFEVIREELIKRDMWTV